MSEHEATAVAKPAHSKFGGSSAARWMACAGSVALCDTVPRPPESSYAAEGTVAHALAEHCLVNGLRDAVAMIGEDFPYELRSQGWLDRNKDYTGPIKADMVNAVQVYLDAVYEELDASPDAQLYVEAKFEIRVATAEEGEVFGANDAMVYTPSKKRARLFDYKHGAGVSVSAENSAQLKFYATGAMLSHADWPISEVILTVVQPRSRDAEENNGGVKDWPMDVLELIEFAGEIETAIGLAKIEQRLYAEKQTVQALDLNPGTHCRWCPAAAVCPAKERQVVQAVGLDFAEVVNITPALLPKPAELDTARLAKVVQGLKILTAWAEQCQEYVHGLLVQGVAVPGWKLVDKVARRSWIDSDEEITAFLTLVHGLDEANVRPPSLVTITEAEKLLKAAIPAGPGRKEALDELSLKYTVKDSSGVTIAPDSDKRPAVDAVARDFSSPVTIAAPL